MPIQSINPATGEILKSYEPLSREAIADKIAIAHSAFRAFGEIPLEHRGLCMRKLAGILEHEVDELAALLTTEVGKTITASHAEILKCAAACRYFAENAARILAEEPIPTEHDSYVRWDPLGVLLAVMPWNFPFWQVFRFVAPALMAGNTVLLKHASNVPQCAATIEALVRRSGFPRGILQNLFIESHQVESVLGDERVAAVTVTGSEAAGRAVAAQAGWLIKKSVLELGGSDPFIVMETADLALAVQSAITSRTVNNGQSCIAAKRFIIHQSLYDDFETLFVAGMEELTIGDPMAETTQIGPIATAQLLNDLNQQVQAARNAGAKILCGGEPMVGKGNFFEPTVIAGLPRNSAVYRDEIFGPVALLFPASSIEEAIQIANDTPFGLGASIWTNDLDEQSRLIAELECGQVFVNTIVASDPRLPFGGIKRSGYGRELSAAGMREFLNAKTVVIAAPMQQTVIPFESGADHLFEDLKALRSTPEPVTELDEEDTPDQVPEPVATPFRNLLPTRDQSRIKEPATIKDQSTIREPKSSNEPTSSNDPEPSLARSPFDSDQFQKAFRTALESETRKPGTPSEDPHTSKVRSFADELLTSRIRAAMTELEDDKTKK